MGHVVISVDARLGWGRHAAPAPPVERIAAARDGWRALVELFDTFDVPVTWAVVGHLLLTECDGEHEGYPDGWFARDRGGWGGDRGLLEAPALVDAVLDSGPDHELAAHTFSNVAFAEASRELARREVINAIRAAHDRGLEPRTFVFPGQPVHRDLLAEWGFSAYCGRGPRGRPGWLRRVGQRLLGNRRPPLARPRLDEFGLVRLPRCSAPLGARSRSLLDAVGSDGAVRAAQRGIDAAADSDGGVFHLRLRPAQVARDSDRDRLRTVLAYLDDGPVSVETVGTIADRALAEPSTTVVPY
jgi:peptidoglycan/xylan/chitin deacetylase (PgdA/CDA1 family)